jgi:hypothetical protein
MRSIRLPATGVLSVTAASGRRTASSVISAAEPLNPEARKSPPSDQVSLQIGWLETLSRTPV